jgi:D-lactate dehydrogenase
VDLAACRQHGIVVNRVPAYSPHAVAEHAFALLLARRRIHKSYVRCVKWIFAGWAGRFDLYRKTMGVVGTGRIGQATISIAKGFGMRVLAFDVFRRPGWMKSWVLNMSRCRVVGGM